MAGPQNLLRSVPHLYYAEPFGGRDILGKEVHATLFVDIAATLSRKAQMLSCHESQQDFLRAQQGIPYLLDMMRAMADRAGRISHLTAAEGFRQHLGQGFPQEELLGRCSPGVGQNQLRLKAARVDDGEISAPLCTVTLPDRYWPRFDVVAAAMYRLFFIFH